MKLQGYKTYLIALVMIVHATATYFLGKDNAPLDLREILAALGLSALRAGVAKGPTVAALLCALLLPSCLLSAAAADKSPAASRETPPTQPAIDLGGKTLSVDQEAGVFRAGEIGLDFFGSARTSDFDVNNARGGAGFGLSYFPLRGAGLRVEGSTENAQHSLVDAAGLTLLGRLASDKLRTALEFGIGFNGHFDGNQWIEDRTFSIHAEAGPRFRITRNWDIWAKVRGVRAATTSEGEHIQFLVGTGLNF